MSIMNMLSGLLSGANSTNSAGASPATSAPAPAQSFQASAQHSQVPAGAGRDNGVLLAQAQQASQAPQAQSPETQIENLFKLLDPMAALNLLMKLMSPFMGMLGMGSAPAAEKPAQAQAQLGLRQAAQAQDPQTLQAIDQVMAQLGQGQAPQANTSDGLDAMLQNILNPAPQNGTPSELKVSLASQNANKPAQTQAPTLVA